MKLFLRLVGLVLALISLGFSKTMARAQMNGAKDSRAWAVPSPDGTWIASMEILPVANGNEGEANAQLVILHKSRKTKRVLFRTHLADEYYAPGNALVWSADSRYFYFDPTQIQYVGCGGDCYRLGDSYGIGRLLRADVKLNRVTRFLNSADAILISPDRNRLAYLKDNTLVIKDLLGKRRDKKFALNALKRLPSGKANKDSYGSQLAVVGSMVWSPDQSQIAFTILFNPCEVADAVMTSIVRVDVNTHQETVLRSPTLGFMKTLEWTKELGLVVEQWNLTSAGETRYLQMDADTGIASTFSASP